MKLEKIKYSDLNSKQKEIHNFQKVAGLLADYGFNCIKLADDWQGADFLAYHHNGDSTLKVQLKGRITIDKKYLDKDIYMAFPCHKEWYLIEHQSLIDIVEKNTPWLDSVSWKIKGAYSANNPSKKLLEAINFAKL
jgi:hypothetical protein